MKMSLAPRRLLEYMVSKKVGPLMWENIVDLIWDEYIHLRSNNTFWNGLELDFKVKINANSKPFKKKSPFIIPYHCIFSMGTFKEQPIMCMGCSLKNIGFQTWVATDLSLGCGPFHDQKNQKHSSQPGHTYHCASFICVKPVLALFSH